MFFRFGGTIVKCLFKVFVVTILVSLIDFLGSEDKLPTIDERILVLSDGQIADSLSPEIVPFVYVALDHQQLGHQVGLRAQHDTLIRHVTIISSIDNSKQ